MAGDARITAPISGATRDRLARYIRRTGVSKGYLIEQALLHHLQALDELPTEYVIQPRIVVSRRTGDLLRATRSAKPTPALRKLMR
jgi:hypothetical protein